MKMHKTGLIGAIAAVAVAGGVMADSVTYNFNQIGGSFNPGTDGSNFSVTISHDALGGGLFGTVSFEFSNNFHLSSFNGNITNAYFSIGADNWIENPAFTPSGLVSQNDSSVGMPGGSAAQWGLRSSTPPGNIPLRNQGGWVFDGSGGVNGITPGNSWTVTFNLVQSYQTMLDAVVAGFGVPPFNTGQYLTIGLQAQGMNDEASGQYIMTGDPGDPNPIPLPAPVWVGLAGLAGIMVIRRRRA